MHWILVALILSSVDLETRYRWNRDRMKRLDLINKRLRERIEARAYINNFNKAMLEYYRVFAKQIELLPLEP